jgi:hypothetical protein
MWGCCGGSSGSPGNTYYRGPAPFSAPETNAIRNFVESRVIDGQQQIRAHIDLHSSGEYILWPYGYTYADIPLDMAVDDQNVFVTMAQTMAALNGYRPRQSSDLYIVDGSQIDWMYGVHGIFSFIFELYPRTSAEGGPYPPDEIIPAQTARNREAILYFLDLADCPYRAIGRGADYCAGNTLPPTPTATATPGADLRGYWTLDETNGQRFDNSGQNNHLSDTNGVTTQAGQVGLAADFERANRAYLSLSDAAQTGLDLSGSLTLVGWFRPETVERDQVLVSKYDYGNNGRAYRLDLRTGNRIGFIVSPDGTFTTDNLLEASPSFSINTSSWYHLAGVFDAQEQTMTLYLNGVLLATRVVAFNGINNSAAPFMLGANLSNGAPTQFYDGLLDDWRVYNRPLSQTEILSLINP